MAAKDSEAIKVVARFRPLNEREQAQLGRDGASPGAPRFGDDGRSVWVGPDESSGHSYAVDAVLSPDASQADVYAHASGLVDAVMQGYNATILAYGQTGAGKTHSVMGVLGGDDNELGLLPRAVRQLFESIVADDSGAAEFAVSCSYLEIYMENVRDLLQPPQRDVKPGTSLAIREAIGGRGVYVEGLTEVPVMGENDVLEILSCGNASRVVGATLMNAQSSRSHALLTITVHQRLRDGSTKVSKLNIADLAGSEKVAKTGSSGETLNEAKKINASLSTLCLVIAALSEGKPHIPYRNSRLTRILQESLGGNSKTMMLVACSPATVHAPETHSTLRFATQCKRVKNAAVVNRVLSAAQLRSANDALRRELAAVKERLASVEGGALGSGAGGGAAAGVALGAGGCPSLIDSLLDGEDLLGEAIEPTGGGSVGGSGGAGGSGGGLSAEEVELLREQCEAAEMAAQAAQAELLEERSKGDEIAISLKKREEEVLPLMDSDGF